MGRIATVAYRPKPGRLEDLLQLISEHLLMLRAEALARDRPAVAMQASDGTVVKVCEWASKEDTEQAHRNETVQALWRRYAAACDYIPIAQVPEAARLFSEFTPLEVQSRADTHIHLVVQPAFSRSSSSSVHRAMNRSDERWQGSLRQWCSD